MPILQSDRGDERQDSVTQDNADKELAAYFDHDEDTDDISEYHNRKLSVVLSEVGGVVDCLLRLSVTISNPAPHDRYRSKAGNNILSYEPWDIQHVKEKFPHLSDLVCERLGRALTRRRRYFKYRENHNDRLQAGLDQGDSHSASIGKATTVASSSPNHVEDSIAPSLAAFNDDVSEASLTSYAPSNVDRGELRVPPIPQGYIDGPVLCPYCYVFISVQSRHEWK